MEDAGRFADSFDARASGSPRVAALEAQLSDLEARFEKTGLGRNLLHVRSIPLGADLDGVAAVAPAIEDFKQRTRTRAEVQAAAPRGPLEAAYAGAGACVNCHTQEFARWGFSGHARAWQSLVKRKATDNPECVGCHSTAYGEAGGLGELTPANIRKYRDVQCEACHGPLGGHPDDDRVESLESQLAGGAATTRCLDFEFAPYLREASVSRMRSGKVTGPMDGGYPSRSDGAAGRGRRRRRPPVAPPAG